MGLSKGVYGDDEPVPLAAEDLGAIVTSKPVGPVITTLSWSRIDDEAFEGLIFGLISTETCYEDAQWLMQTRAPDSGRDLSVRLVIPIRTRKR